MAKGKHSSPFAQVSGLIIFIINFLIVIADSYSRVHANKLKSYLSMSYIILL